MAANEDDLAAGEEKRALCRKLALFFRARKVIDGFLADVDSFDFPKEWHQAVAVMRTSDIEDTEKTVEKMMQTKEYREIVMLAKKDARKLTSKEIEEGKIAT